MREVSRAVEVAVTILLAAGAATAGVGVYQSSSDQHAAIWGAAAALCFLFAVIGPIVFFGVHPVFERHRSRMQAASVTPPGEGSRPISTDELRDYLRDIRTTMEEEGFEERPSSAKEVQPSVAQTVEEERGALL